MKVSELYGKYAPLVTGRNQWGTVSFFMKRHYRALGLKGGTQAFVKAALEYRFSLHQTIPSVRYLAVETGYSYRHVLRIVDKLEALGYAKVIRRLGHPTHLDFTPLLDIFLELLHEEQEELRAARPARPAKEERREMPARQVEETETAPDPFVVAAQLEREQVTIQLEQRELDFGEVLHDLPRQVTNILAWKKSAGWEQEDLQRAMYKAGQEASRATSSRFGLYLHVLAREAKDAAILKAVRAEDECISEIEAELERQFRHFYHEEETYDYEQALRVNEQLIALRASRDARLREVMERGG